MNNSISQIIKEEIDNAVIFEKLKQSHDKLLPLYERVRRTDTSASAKPISDFFQKLLEFTFALIQALERCYNKKNLNEGLGYNRLGFQDVPALSNLYHAMKRGWQNGGIKFNRTAYVNPNTNNYQSTQNIRLKDLIYQHYIDILNLYQRVNKKYNGYLDNLNPPLPRYIFQQVDYIKSILETTR